MRITQALFKDFPPFADATLESPSVSSEADIGEVQLFAGQNGAGKTRLLCLLAGACGNSEPLNARLGKSGRGNAVVVVEHEGWYGIWERGSDRVRWNPKPVPAKESIWRYVNQSPSAGSPRITSPPGKALDAASLAFRGTAQVANVSISALASVKIGAVADHLTFEPAQNEDQIICQSRANLIMVAAMDKRRELPEPESRAGRILERLETTMSSITGRDFSFDATPHPKVDLRAFWGSVAMHLLQLPDGLRSIIGWLVSCAAKLEALFPENPDPLSVPLILLLDEPEGHLHPAWQRKVLPAAQMLFPQAQIFAATHSPFVISSVNEGWVHILRADEAGVVTVEPSRECSKGDTYLDVVEDILGVKEWYDPETEDLLAKFRQTRDAVLNGSGELDTLKGLAREIAGRSYSLRDLIAREMRQVKRAKAAVGSSS